MHMKLFGSCEASHARLKEQPKRSAIALRRLKKDRESFSMIQVKDN